MICGVDEAGRGPVIGPLVVAGVTFENDIKLMEYNIRDSKQITPKRRETLAQKIKQLATSYELIVIPASDIDDMRKVMTLNEIEVHLFTKIIQKLKPDICYVDAADVNETRFGKEISSKLSFKTKLISKHKADAIYPVVGAASILAKTQRDREIQRIAQELEKKLNKPLGSGYPSDPTTKEFLKTWFDLYRTLPPHVRHSWKTAQNIIRERTSTRLDDF